MQILFMYNSCVIWKYHPFDMYIHFHTIGLIGVTELDTVTLHFAPNQRWFHWSISLWILLRRKKQIMVRDLSRAEVYLCRVSVFWNRKILPDFIDVISYGGNMRTSLNALAMR